MGPCLFRAETIRGYLQGVHQQFLADFAERNGRSATATSDDLRDALRNSSLAMLGAAGPSAAQRARIEIRFRYNQDFDSIYAMAPGTMALLLALIPAILMALAIVREKELGSITNLYVTPIKRVEFLLGKQLPYVAIAMVNFALLCVMIVLLFRVPMKGSFLALFFGALLYVTSTTGIGMLISAFCRTQIAALFGTAIVTVLLATQFSGMLTPVSSLSGAPAIMGLCFPMTYFLKVSVGVFTKGLGFKELAGSLFLLAVFIPILTALSLMFLRKQET